MNALLEKDNKHKQCLGQCASKDCKKDIYNTNLYVEEDGKLYHYSCYNEMKSENSAR